MTELGRSANQLAIELHQSKAKLKTIKDQIKWAEEQIESPEYKDDPESQAFFKGIIFLGKILDD